MNYGKERRKPGLYDEDLSLRTEDAVNFSQTSVQIVWDKLQVMKTSLDYHDIF